MKKTIAACIAATFAVNYSTTAIAEEAFMAPLVEQSVLLDIDADTFVVIVGERGHEFQRMVRHLIKKPYQHNQRLQRQLL